MQLAGNHHIEILEPLRTTLESGATRTVLSKRLDAWANRDDTGGQVYRDGEQERPMWDTRFTIRSPVGDVQPQPNWFVRDVANNYYRIEDVGNADRRGIHINLDCERDPDK